MATDTKSELKASRNPPYIPWKTFENYIGGLKGSTVPHTLDGSIKPKGMAGGMWRQLLSAIRFLGLTKEGNVVDDSLESLVASHGTDQWGQAVKETILPAYDDIVGDLPLDNATPGQLNKCFVDRSGANGQVLDKCVRFYLHALKHSGTKYSSHLSMREPGASPKRNVAGKRRQKPKSTEQSGDTIPHTPPARNQPEAAKTPTGMIDFPIPIGDMSSFIRIPRSITMDQYPMVAAIMNAVETLAKQNGAK